MPELPEIETILQGIKPVVINRKIKKVTVRKHDLRWPIPSDLGANLQDLAITSLERRGKYLLFGVGERILLVHLGMSGQLRRLKSLTSPKIHDHVDILLDNNTLLRYTDPRRFGSILLIEKNTPHPLLKNMGPEPLTPAFNADYLYEKIKKKRVAIKSLLMNSHIVAGIGNIYAAEALFLAKIHPETSAGSLTQKQCHQLIEAMRKVLEEAILQGGTTLRDFVKSDGLPGYFKVKLNVYGRERQPCHRCKTTLILLKISNRSTVFCPKCQPQSA